MWTRLSTLFSGVLILGGGIGILYPAIFDEKIGLTQILISLFHPEMTQSFAMRWLLAFLLFCGFYVVTLTFYNRNRPVTILSADIKATLANNEWSKTIVEGTFVLRANHPNVTSYRTIHSPDYGTLVLDSMKADVYCEAFPLTSEIELNKMEGDGIELLQLFNKPLPSMWYMPLIPNYFVSRNYDDLPHFLRKRLVKRRTSLSYLDEHNVDLPAMRFQAPNYNFMSMHIVLEFPIDALPKSLKARRELNGALTDMPIEVVQNLYHVRVNKLAKSEVVRISWKRA
ncbi:hypothetical protein ACYG9R_09155 [Mesorhizobium sp. RSR565B]|uniref:hypothetical protein n=1 Tax=Mesorhizobium sp. L103C565B0 TaxID=1287094 RepID=UPI0004CE4731|nr:hypothetical protein [Mesorhizobium sp. L103C565B0]